MKRFLMAALAASLLSACAPRYQAAWITLGGISTMWLVLGFAVSTVFAIWIVFFDGAEELEGTIESAFLISVMAPMLSASHLRLYVAFGWFAQLIIILLRVVS